MRVSQDDVAEGYEIHGRCGGWGCTVCGGEGAVESRSTDEPE